MKIKHIFTILFLHLSLISFAEKSAEVEVLGKVSAQKNTIETEKTEKVGMTTDFAKHEQGDDDDEFSYSRKLRRFHRKNRHFCYFDPYYTSNVYYTINTPAWTSYYYTSFVPFQASSYSYFGGNSNVYVMYLPTYYNGGYAGYYSGGNAWGNGYGYSYYNGCNNGYWANQGYWNGNANNAYNCGGQNYYYDAFYWKNSQNNGNFGNLSSNISVNNPRNDFEKQGIKNVNYATQNAPISTEISVKHTEIAQQQTQPNFAHNPKGNFQTPKNQGYSNYSTPKTGYESVNVKPNVTEVYSNSNSHSHTPKTVHSYENPQFEHSSKDFSKHEGGYAKASSWKGNAEPRTTQNGQQTVSFENKPTHYGNSQSVSHNEGNEGRVKVPQLRKAGLSYKTPFEIVP